MADADVRNLTAMMEFAALSAGLVGVLLGGAVTFVGQWAADRRARARADWIEHGRVVAALRLLAMDLERSSWRLARMNDGDRRGFMELPRGAWLEYRTLLAPHLDGTVLKLLVAAYNEVIEWNGILWATFASAAPPTFHGSDQHRLEPQEAADLLQGMRQPLDECVTRAREVVSLVCASEEGLAASDFLPRILGLRAPRRSMDSKVGYLPPTLRP